MLSCSFLIQNLHTSANYLALCLPFRYENCQIVKFRQHLKASVGLAIVLAQCGPCKMVLCSWSMCSLNIH